MENTLQVGNQHCSGLSQGNKDFTRSRRLERQNSTLVPGNVAISMLKGKKTQKQKLNPMKPWYETKNKTRQGPSDEPGPDHESQKNWTNLFVRILAGV